MEHSSGGRGPHNLQDQEPGRRPPYDHRNTEGGRKCTCGIRPRMTKGQAEKAGIQGQSAPGVPTPSGIQGQTTTTLTHRGAPEISRASCLLRCHLCPFAKNTHLKPCSSTLSGYFSHPLEPARKTVTKNKKALLQRRKKQPSRAQNDGTSSKF